MELPEKCEFLNNSVEQLSLEKVQSLYEDKILALWPEFSNCFPICGLCAPFTSDLHYNVYNLVVIGILLPLIGLFGLIGNSISAFIYSRPRVQAKLGGSLYLSALGCSDNGVILTALFLFFVETIRRYSLTLSILFGSMSPVIYPLAMIAQTCSVYFTLIAGVDFFIQLFLPFCIRRVFHCRRFMKWLIGGTVIFSVLYNLPHFFEAIVLNCWHSVFDAKSVEVCPSQFRYDPTYIMIYYQYMYSIFLAVGPLLILVMVNVAIISNALIRKSKANFEDNMALILVVCLFVLCNTIALLINIFEQWLSSVLLWRINYLIDFSNLLVVLNSSLNFIIYYNFSRPFRDELNCCFNSRTRKKLCLKNNEWSPANGDLTSESDSLQRAKSFLTNSIEIKEAGTHQKESKKFLCTNKEDPEVLQNKRARKDSGIEVEPSNVNTTNSNEIIYVEFHPSDIKIHPSSIISITII